MQRLPCNQIFLVLQRVNRRVADPYLQLGSKVAAIGQLTGNIVPVARLGHRDADAQHVCPHVGGAVPLKIHLLKTCITIVSRS
jgi:hypothetical protein